MKYFISSITVLVILSSRHSGLAAERGIASIAENSVESLKLTRALAAAHAAVVAADAELAKVRIASPALGNSSKNLTIGEFERVEQFESRKKIAREAAEVADKNAHKIALTAWQMSIDQRTAKLNAVKKSLDSLRKTTAIRMEELERVRTDVVAATYSPERRTLPLFDRDRMSFGVLEIQRLPEEIIDTQDNSMVTRLNFTFPKFEIELPTLEDGARFKEEYQASKLSFRWRFHPQLVRTESPIIDPGKTRVKEIDQVTVRSAGITLALVGVAVALGAEPPRSPITPPTEKVTVTTQDPRIVRNGVRFHYEFALTEPPMVVYADGRRFEGANVVLLEEYVYVVKLLDKPQVAARVLKTGDEIVSVDGHSVHNSDELPKNVKGVPAGRTFPVVYRRLGVDRSFEAVGGQLLGIQIETGTRKKPAAR